MIRYLPGNTLSWARTSFMRRPFVLPCTLLPENNFTVYRAAFTLPQCIALCWGEKKREEKQTWLGFFSFFFFNCSEIKIEDVFWLTPAAEAQAFLQVSRLAFSFFPFSLLSNKATFHIKHIGCLIAAKCISHRVGPRQGLCSLCIIRLDIESHPLSLGSIHQHPPVHFLLQLSAFLTDCPPRPSLSSGYSYCAFWIKASLRCSTTFSTDFKKNKTRKVEQKPRWTRCLKTGCLGNLVVTRTHHMSRLGLWVMFYLGTAKAPSFTTHLQRGKLLRGNLPPQQARKLGQSPFNLMVPENC